MLWIYLIVLQILFFVGLLYFLRSVLAQNLRKATGHLQELSKDYVSKEEEASQLLQNAQKESKAIVVKEKQAAEEAREKMIKEAHDLKEKILKDANKRAAEIAEKAERNAEFLRNELEQKINDRAKQLVFDLMGKTIPEEFLKDVHEHWIKMVGKGALSSDNLKLPKGTREAKIVSAFELSDQLKDELRARLAQEMGGAVDLSPEIDPTLMAGFVMTIGSVVIDASLKYKMQKAMREQ